MKIKRMLLGLGALLLLFSCVSTVAFLHAKKAIDTEFFEAVGDGAEDLASLISKSIILTDEQVAHLKTLTYAELMRNELNIKLHNAVKNVSYNTPVQFIYLVTKLAPNEVKYHVDAAHREFYGVPAGTPLDVMWLLDVFVASKQELPAYDSNDDMQRYSIYTSTLDAAFSKNASTHTFTSDEWGEVISGYAPVYTTSGNFVGLLGVDLSTISYTLHTRHGFLQLLFVFCLTTLLLAILLIVFYLKYLRVKDKEMYRDPLTQAYNRRFFNELFWGELKRSHRTREYLAIMMIDIDHFKYVNDTYGHAKGDVCLGAVSQAIYQSLREPPHLLVRYGGEEFFLGVSVDHEADAASLMNDVLNNIRALSLFEDGHKITVSIGACLMSKTLVTADAIEKLIRTSDQNMYIAKDNGRDRFYLTIEQ